MNPPLPRRRACCIANDGGEDIFLRAALGNYAVAELVIELGEPLVLIGRIDRRRHVETDEKWKYGCRNSCGFGGCGGSIVPRRGLCHEVIAPALVYIEHHLNPKRMPARYFLRRKRSRTGKSSTDAFAKTFTQGREGKQADLVRLPEAGCILDPLPQPCRSLSGSPRHRTKCVCRFGPGLPVRARAASFFAPQNKWPTGFHYGALCRALEVVVGVSSGSRRSPRAGGSAPAVV
ncbi:hypothetical protein E4O86_19795 [Rhizobiales bacterium L72]|uniref:Uncharacterized protein n=1 Tax=Propylenella binzhouense TaxID=2555902 RepID=A0A964WVE0_9HYPH|nr:hypothetical protein [Propylenella binzhouense]